MLPNSLFPAAAAAASQWAGGAKNHHEIGQLSNGIRFICESSPSSIPLTSVYAFVKVGSVCEHDGIRGTSHLVEHMLFKGTKKRPKNIANIYDDFGAYINAFTDKEVTCYTIKCNDDHLEPCVNVLADMLLNSTFPRGEFKKEYQVVIEEAKKDADDYDILLESETKRILYAGGPLEWPVDDLSYHGADARGTLTHSDAVQFYREWYQTNNMAISVVTNLSAGAVRDILEKSFGRAARGGGGPSMPVGGGAAAVAATGAIKYIRRPNLETIYISVAFPTCDQSCEDKYALNLLSTILAGPMSSWFFQTLREKNGLTYGSAVTGTYYSTGGDLTINTRVNKDKFIGGGAPKLFQVLVALLRRLRRGVRTADVKMAREYKRGEFTRALEDNDNMANHNGMELLFGMSAPSLRDLYDEKYDHLTARDINDVIKKYIIPAKMSIVIIGSAPEDEIIPKVAAELKKGI